MKNQSNNKEGKIIQIYSSNLAILRRRLLIAKKLGYHVPEIGGKGGRRGGEGIVRDGEKGKGVKVCGEGGRFAKRGY